MKYKNFVFLFLVVLLQSSFVFGESVQRVNRKTQKVDFDSEMIEGQARHPDAAYVVQKRGVDFVPLYRVRENFDENLKGSINYLK